jgi:threonyl-tRNA synthetase
MAGVISVRLPDGSQRELAEGTTAGEFALSIGRGLAKSAVVATVDGHQVDLSTPLPDGADVAIITAESEVGRQVLRHSTSARSSRTVSITTSSSRAGLTSATTTWSA